MSDNRYYVELVKPYHGVWVPRGLLHLVSAEILVI
jgi:hypothetical protein